MAGSIPAAPPEVKALTIADETVDSVLQVPGLLFCLFSELPSIRRVENGKGKTASPAPGGYLAGRS